LDEEILYQLFYPKPKHIGSPSFTYQFCCDSHRRNIDLDLYEDIYVVGTLKILKLLSWHIVSKKFLSRDIAYKEEWRKHIPLSEFRTHGEWL